MDFEPKKISCCGEWNYKWQWFRYRRLLHTISHA